MSGSDQSTRLPATPGPLTRHRFSVLLGTLFILLVAAPLVHESGPARHPWLAGLIITIVFAVTLLAAVFAVSTSRRWFIVAVSSVAPAILLQIIGLFVEGQAVEIAKAAFGVLALGLIVVVLLQHLFRASRVTHDTVAASLCVYVLFGVIWALLYTLVAAAQPGSFSFSFAAIEIDETMRFGAERTIIALYYSFVTLTTLGYGDITPVSAPARMLSAVEAIVGQLYIAVLVARLVGLNIAHARAVSR